MKLFTLSFFVITLNFYQRVSHSGNILESSSAKIFVYFIILCYWEWNSNCTLTHWWWSENFIFLRLARQDLISRQIVWQRRIYFGKWLWNFTPPKYCAHLLSSLSVRRRSLQLFCRNFIGNSNNKRWLEP